MNEREIFRKQLVAWGLSLHPGAKERLYDYARLLCTYERANVIGTKEVDWVLLDHVLDSLSCLLFPPLASASRISDVGSGGGLPGIPLAVALRDASLTLLEATGKKAAFLRYAVERLDLTGVDVVNARVEEAAHESGRRAVHDVCTVRAVAGLPVLVEYSLPLLKVGGYMVAMKGHVSEQERAEGERAAHLMGGTQLPAIDVPLLPEIKQKARQLVVVRKTSETPDVYPRRIGVPVKSPLGRR